MSKRDVNLKLRGVRVERFARELKYMCKADSHGMVRFGVILLPRLITKTEATQLENRLKNKRLGDIEAVLRDVLKVEIGKDVDYGDVTPNE